MEDTVIHLLSPMEKCTQSEGAKLYKEAIFFIFNFRFQEFGWKSFCDSIEEYDPIENKWREVENIA